MTKKHFIALADMVKRARGTEAEFNDDQLAMLAEFCEADNSMFKRNRWMDYINDLCGKNGGKVKQSV